jgi:hypothetical protein
MNHSVNSRRPPSLPKHRHGQGRRNRQGRLRSGSARWPARSSRWAIPRTEAALTPDRLHVVEGATVGVFAVYADLLVELIIQPNAAAGGIQNTYPRAHRLFRNCGLLLEV